MRFFFYLVLLTAFTACGNDAAKTEMEGAETPESTEVNAESNVGKVFGAEEDFSSPIDYNTMLTKLTAAPQDTMQLTVRGKVNEVCQAKGCWMTIDGEDEVMVKFKDYGFFMPLDIAGREVIMHGKAYYQTTPVDELRHYAEDAGKSAEEIAAITEPKREMRFLASGVKLLN